ncbi:hypothetical protein [Rathayibacter oskolensis]|uniref:hypothetical protein n=1 Tax=Rathayibacter oskolensis TaxID=1891671 RepID=UPI000A1CF237|nr:hypothetical protein [Rathayibacter oskolensis]
MTPVDHYFVGITAVLLTSVLAEVWPHSAPEVLQLRAFTGSLGQPTKSAREYLLPPVLAGVLSKTALSSPRTVLSDDAAEQVRALLVEGRASLRAAAVWWAALIEANRLERVIRDDAAAVTAPTAVALAEELPEPWTLEPAALARRASEALSIRGRALARHGIRSTDLARAVRDHAQELTMLLEEAWAGGSVDGLPAGWVEEGGAVREATSAERDARARDDAGWRAALERFVNQCTLAVEDGTDRVVTVVSDAGEQRWRALVAAADSRQWSPAASLSLTGGSAPVRPALTGALPGVAGRAGDDLRATPAYPLDASIHSRLFRVVKDNDARFPPELTAEDAFRRVIGASTRVYGLPESWSRAMLATGMSAMSGATWDDGGGTLVTASEAADPADRLVGGYRQMVVSWRAVVSRAFSTYGDQVRNPIVRAYLRDAGPYYAGRLWTHVLRLGLTSSTPPTGEVAWSRIHAAFVSTKKRTDDVLKQAVNLVGVTGGAPGGPPDGSGPGGDGYPSTATADDPARLPAGPRPDLPIVSATAETLGVARETVGDDEVDRFVLVVGAPTPDAAARAGAAERWAAWSLEAERAGFPTVPFELAALQIRTAMGRDTPPGIGIGS